MIDKTILAHFRGDTECGCARHDVERPGGEDTLREPPGGIETGWAEGPREQEMFGRRNHGRQWKKERCDAQYVRWVTAASDEALVDGCCENQEPVHLPDGTWLSPDQSCDSLHVYMGRTTRQKFRWHWHCRD